MAINLFNFLKKDYLTDWQKIVVQINNLEKEFVSISDDQLKEKTNEFRERLRKGQSLDEILPEAFALVREAAKRTLGQRHFDVQLLGGIGLHKGMVVEMMTGEGKTITATLSAYLNALTGEGVHIVTVNDYLAQRDTVWMGQIYYLLGLSVACLVHDQSFIYDPSFVREKLDEKRDVLGVFQVYHEYLRPISRREAYLADIVYGTNHEFGFDYLRDNLIFDPENLVQVKPLNYAIIDEVDSILIDEARTPLIIGGQEVDDYNIYYFYDKLVKKLEKDIDFTIDEKKRKVFLTEEGLNKLEKILGYNPYEVLDVKTTHHLEQALNANYLYFRDRDYVVKNNEVIIVDEFTGRLMFGRRWSGGLHQAIEAKENVPIRAEMKTVATITIQNFFRKYKKLAGMTGTAVTSAEEFLKVYNLEVVVIPPNKKCIRKDHPDKVFVNEEAKWKAVVEKVKELYQIGRPVLIGTTSIEKNEKLSEMLRQAGIPHNVLNAKNHEEEGRIIAQAGNYRQVTVATNMAGRGVDIILGGNPPDLDMAQKIREVGGLFVIGTERHEARRIDNQLRGRCGRQGDPGETQFYISLEDDLIKIFAGDRVKSLIERFKFPVDQAIENSLITKLIEDAQEKIEGFNFDIRKHLLEYDNVINAQREKIYSERREFLLSPLKAVDYFKREIRVIIDEESDDVIKFVFNTDKEKVEEVFNKKFEELNNIFNDEFDKLLRQIILRAYDYLWIEHLHYLEDLKQSVGFRGYGQRDPLVSFKTEAYEAFINFHKILRINTFQMLMNIQISLPSLKIGRNDPCPCGSGKKYKKCGLLNTLEHQENMKKIKNKK
ncbi:MAG: protein translocase subunit SecA [Candidatus Parcubacteria bacterium]|nr:MAG: protein translocase subunit SecA [Candidatus Parcubacteria bacterium]